MAKKNLAIQLDEYEEEYGSMQTIYITETVQKRLNGDEEYGKWYETCRYGTSPTVEFCIKTTVPESALEDRLFHPDRFEPDVVAERCEKVSPKEISNQSKTIKTKARFKKGTKVRRTFYGIGGYTEVSEDVVDSISKGVVRTVACENGITFDTKTGKELENFFAGMHQEIVPLDELPESEPKNPNKKKSK